MTARNVLALMQKLGQKQFMPNIFFKYGILTLLVVLWAMAVVSFVTIVTFLNTPDIPTGTAAALATVYGLPAIAIGLYKWRNEKNANK